MTDENGNVDLIAWPIAVTECATSPLTELPYSFDQITSIYIDPSTTTTPGTHTLQVNVDGVNDPRLVRIPKTTIQPGLYEIKVVLKDGRVLRHYEDFAAPITINSRFASFVDENIYPVPVTGNRFAVDMDLLFPMIINFTVVDNMGTPKYNATWTFPQAGRNKQVIDMNPLWNNGLYHAIFQFPDGSSDTKQFNIAH